MSVDIILNALGEHIMSVMSAQTGLVPIFSIDYESKDETTYYRSKLFISPKTSNPILSAAGPLFSILERLSSAHDLPSIKIIWDNLDHELKAFVSRLKSFECADEISAIAQYLLSATIDELLAKNDVRLNATPSKFMAFTPTSQSGIGPEKRFFEILDYIKTRPNQYLDLIELAYYCLISGFEGEAHFNPLGRQTIDNCIESLHELIKHHRVAKPERLFSKPRTPETAKIDRKPLYKQITISAAALFCVFAISQTLLEHKANIVLDTQHHIYSTSN